MEFNFYGDNINTRTIVQKNDQGVQEVFILLTPELIKYLEEIQQKINRLEGIVLLSEKIQALENSPNP